MKEDEFRAKQIEWDSKSLDKRVERWKQIIPAVYEVPLPELVWGYLSEVDKMYIAGHFLGTIVFCACIAELILADQIKSKVGMKSKEVERFGLEQLIILGRRLAILDESAASWLNRLRKLRNYLIHGNVGQLTKMAKRSYKVAGSDDSFLDADFYIHSGFEGGIDRDAFLTLMLVRGLSVAFYGEHS